MTATVRTGLEGFIGELLHDFKNLATSIAAIFINWHWCQPSRNPAMTLASVPDEFKYGTGFRSKGRLVATMGLEKHSAGRLPGNTDSLQLRQCDSSLVGEVP